MVFGMMLVGGLVAGGVMAHYANKDNYRSMAGEQEQEEQLQQAQAQAEEAERAAQPAELQAKQAQTRGPIENKDDPLHKLEKLATLREQGLITEEEFQRMKSKLISTIRKYTAPEDLSLAAPFIVP
jgi:hypothetical protein